MLVTCVPQNVIVYHKMVDVVMTSADVRGASGTSSCRSLDFGRLCSPMSLAHANSTAIGVASGRSTVLPTAAPLELCLSAKKVKEIDVGKDETSLCQVAGNSGHRQQKSVWGRFGADAAKVYGGDCKSCRGV